MKALFTFSCKLSLLKHNERTHTLKFVMENCATVFGKILIPNYNVGK